MSFILDAIKKSEDERQKNRSPDVHSLQGGGVVRPAASSAGWRFASFLLSLLLIAAIGYWLWPQLASQFSSPAANPQPGPAELAQTQAQTQAQFQPPGPAQAAAANSQAVSNTVASVPRPAAAGNTAGTVSTQALQSTSYSAGDELPPRHLIKEFWELPADFQSTVPDMEFSFHVFSKDPARRTIIINGRTMKEGQMVASGLKLRVITTTGVILHYRDRFFHIDVVEKW